MTALPPTMPPIHLSDRQRLDWLRLIRSENVGPATFRDLLRHFGSAAAALEGIPDLVKRSGRRIRLASSEEAEREIAGHAAIGAHPRAQPARRFPVPRWLSFEPVGGALRPRESRFTGGSDCGRNAAVFDHRYFDILVVLVARTAATRRVPRPD